MSDKLKEQATKAVDWMRANAHCSRSYQIELMTKRFASALTDYEKALQRPPWPYHRTKEERERDRSEIEQLLTTPEVGRQSSEQPQEWTPHWIFQQACKTDGYRILSDAHNAELAAVRENVVLATQMVHIESKRANSAEQQLRQHSDDALSKFKESQRGELRQ